MSLAQIMHLSQNVFQITTIALDSAINHEYINDLHLFLDALYTSPLLLSRVCGKKYLCANKLALTYLKIRLPTNKLLIGKLHNHLTMCKQTSSGSFKNVDYKLCVYNLYKICIKCI